ncbi:50S ribosomal protein L21e [Candidatus Woesearchaeota archaeon]|nr:50S ribosomal protein L21e [Candidatus Woesearchaeota archaeon]
MVTRIGGSRKKSRQRMKKAPRTRGKISITRYFQELKKGDKVVLKAEPAYHKGLYDLKFHGKICTVEGKKGKCYEVSLKEGKVKTLVVHPVHLKKV